MTRSVERLVPKTRVRGIIRRAGSYATVMGLMDIIHWLINHPAFHEIAWLAGSALLELKLQACGCRALLS
jgi:hypothetical protein